MRKESLEALGAIPLDEETVRKLGLDGLEDEGLTAYAIPAREPSQSRIENYRREIPRTVQAMAQLAVDNPTSFLLVASVDYVLARAVLNIVKPQGLGGIVACAVVTTALGTIGITELMKRGIIEIKMRDEHGCLVPLFGDDA